MHQESRPSDTPLAGVRILVFVGDDYEDLELWYPKLRLEEAGAHVIRGGVWKPRTNPYATVPAFCRVMAQLKPSTDSDIRVEVWLPVAGWNGKLQVVGNGGFAGAIGYPALGTAITDGYVAASTDTGHTGGDPAFMQGHPERVTDFAYRAIHELTVAAKSLSTTTGSAPVSY